HVVDVLVRLGRPLLVGVDYFLVVQDVAVAGIQGANDGPTLGDVMSAVVVLVPEPAGKAERAGQPLAGLAAVRSRVHARLQVAPETVARRDKVGVAGDLRPLGAV